jgi:hypothetical protein
MPTLALSRISDVYFVLWCVHVRVSGGGRGDAVSTRHKTVVS